jgi:hypothetical protein
MKRLVFILLLGLSACAGSNQSKAIVPREGVQSAVINLNIANREANVGALAGDSANLFEAEVGDLESVEFAVESGEQAFIALSDSSPDATIWSIAVNPLVPTAFVVDASEATINGDLSSLTIPLFDVVTANSTIDLTMPASSFQLAFDANESTVNLDLPGGSVMQLNQFTSNSSFITLTTGEAVAFDGAMSITAGGLSINVPASTGVQIVVESADQAEISLPDMERIGAEVMSYQTMNFSTATTQIILRVHLSGAALRVEQH